MLKSYRFCSILSYSVRTIQGVCTISIGAELLATESHIAEYANWIAIRDSNFAYVTKLGQHRLEALWKKPEHSAATNVMIPQVD